MIFFKIPTTVSPAFDSIPPSVRILSPAPESTLATLTAMEVQATDAAGNRQTATICVNFARPGGDVTPPSVSIGSPAPNFMVAGQVSVLINASDNVGVTQVIFQVDGVDELTFAQPPYQFLWNTQALTAGPHEIKGIARDAAGNRATATTTVTKVAPPPTSFTVTGVSPSEAPVGQTVTISGTGFTSIANVRFVSASGLDVDAQFAIDSSSNGTRINATVPAAAVNGFGPVRVKPQGIPAMQTPNSFRALPPR